MITLTFIQADGTRKLCQAEDGWTLMHTAVNAKVEGIEAECNGAAACATCHVVLPQGLYESLDGPGEHEADMLDFVEPPRDPCSRLGCQIPVSCAFDGAVIRVPAR